MGLASLCNEETSDLQGEKQLPARAITTVWAIHYIVLTLFRSFRVYNCEKHGEVKAELQSRFTYTFFFFFESTV